MNWQSIFNRELAIDLGSSFLAVGSSHDLEPMRVGAFLSVAEDRAQARQGRYGRKKSKRADSETPRRTGRLRQAVRHGLVNDAEALDLLLEPVLARARTRGFWRPVLRTRVGLLTPPGLSEDDRIRHRDVAVRHGLSNARLVTVPEAIAYGAGLHRTGDGGRVVIDIGGGKVCIAVWSLGGVVSSHWHPSGGESLDEAITTHVARRYRLNIARLEAERIKISIGSVYPVDEPRRLKISGTQSRTGVPQSIELDDDEIRDVLVDGCEPWVHAMEHAFHDIPPELAGDIGEMGIVITGGGALLTGLPRFFQERTGLTFRIAPDPQNAALRGVQFLLHQGWESAE